MQKIPVENTDTTETADVPEASFVFSNPETRQKVEDLQKLQYQKFMERMNYKSFEPKKMNNISMMNDTSSEDLKKMLDIVSNEVNASLEKVKKINIDVLKKNMDDIMDLISKYNHEIDTWYDDKFFNDKELFFKSIYDNQEHMKLVIDTDFLHFHCRI
jgi:hypothetical protein